MEICVFDVLFYTQRDNLECKEQHIIQLFILLGKYHIHKKKWAQGKHNLKSFIKCGKFDVHLLEQTTNKKAMKTCNALKILDCM